MKFTTSSLSLLAAVSTVLAQGGVTIPATNGSIPTPGPNGCAAGFYPGTDTVLYTVPYTYSQVMSIIGNYTNLTWSGSPDNSVTTNNTAALTTNNWTPGTGRFYTIAGAYLIETITTYTKPANGPYVEFHTLAPFRLPTFNNLTIYGDFDGQIWTPICGGLATTTNFTVNFCSNNATAAAAALHMFHLSDAATVGTFLGGKNFTTCSALMANGTAAANGTSTAPKPATYTGGAVGRAASGVAAVAAAAFVGWVSVGI